MSKGNNCKPVTCFKQKKIEYLTYIEREVHVMLGTAWHEHWIFCLSLAYCFVKMDIFLEVGEAKDVLT
ncbi:hypothetical protein Y1Q_0022909 [Alligator mississippiensis]|uniref:Uncharacterized protein n=1 Tax=Alligator mississippiensis TaxID=8496 RepID=A0A151MZJ1_ALLMI|nr:hypothetical protein Y1Q_0022909 [Alligator mississippiensis]